LYYYNARYYDPKLARFISPDTIVPDPRNPQALNRYSYVLNNPLKYTDPTGHGFFSKLWKSIKKVFKKIIKPAIAAVTAFVVSGGDPAAAVAAAISTAVLDTGEGRKLVRSVGKYFFDNFIGIDNPKLAYMLSYITLDTAMTWGITKAYNHFASGGQRNVVTGSESTKKARFDMKVDHNKWLTFRESERGDMLLAFNGTGQVKDPYYWSRSWNQVNDLSFIPEAIDKGFNNPATEVLNAIPPGTSTGNPAWDFVIDVFQVFRGTWNNYIYKEKR
jgi:hypothetical protein